MNYKLMKFVLVNGGRWYFKRRYQTSVKVFGALGAITVLATVAYVIATSNGKGESPEPIESLRPIDSIDP